MTSIMPVADLSTRTEPHVFVGRQPILDRERRVFGYELLFRSNERDNFFAGTDGDFATRQTINSSLNVVGFCALTAGRQAFINVTRDVLLEQLYLLLPPEIVVIELLESVEPTPEVVQACRDLKDAGYLFALDDFVARPGFEPLLEFADFVKIDFLGTTFEHRAQLAEKLANRRLCLIAEKVENQEDFEDGLRLGYSYFQGYFFCKPTIVVGRQIPALQRNYTRLLQLVVRSDPDFEEIEQVIKQEPSLSIKLLRYLNSSLFGLRSKVNSIRRALALLGQRPLRQWAALVALTCVYEPGQNEIITTCLVRARFCEQIAVLLGLEDRELDLFLTGLLSGIDALMDRPLSEVLAEIPLAHDVKAALLGSHSKLGLAYQLALACERGRPEAIAALTEQLELAAHDVSRLYYRAMLWADKVTRA